MKILVTGGTGYIGSHAVVELLNANHDVVIVDNLVNSKRSVLDKIETLTGKRPDFHEVDLCDREKLDQVFTNKNSKETITTIASKTTSPFDAVIHFAGLKAVGESVEKPLLYFENNVVGTLNLLESMKAHGVKNLIFSSSATVYGEQKAFTTNTSEQKAPISKNADAQNTASLPENHLKYTETMTTGVGITNPYGWTKFMIEEILKSAVAAGEIDSAILLRYFNPIGNHPSGLLGEDPNGIPNNLMPIIMQVARGERPELTVFGDDYPTPDGTCIRDYIHVVDLAKGHLKALDSLSVSAIEKGTSTPKESTSAMENSISVTKNSTSVIEKSTNISSKSTSAKTNAKTKIYNLGSGRGTSVLEMIAAFEAASGEKLPYKIGARRAGDLPEMVADPAKAERELGWKTELTVADAMRDTLKYLAS